MNNIFTSTFVKNKMKYIFTTTSNLAACYSSWTISKENFKI